MISVLGATSTEHAELKPIRRELFILGRYVVAALANITLKNNVIARHLAISDFRLPISRLVFTPVFIPIGNPQLEIGKIFHFRSEISNLSSQSLFQISDLEFEISDLYSTTSDTVPAPTVRPPSLIANRRPFSMAIGAINSMSIATLSPGITISTPVGSVATPVTSVVRK